MSLTNSQYESIIREYKQKQYSAQEEALNRIRFINDNLPGYRELDESIASYATASARSIISGDTMTFEQISQDIDNLTKMKHELLVSAGYPSDYLDIHYECPDCKDTGYIGNKKCHCLIKRINALMLEESNPSSDMSNDDFSMLSYNFYEGEDLQRFKTAVDTCHQFIDNFTENYQNLLFYGTVGTGKSFLSGCIANELLKRNHSVFYFSSTELFRVMSDIMFEKKDKGTLEVFEDRLYNSDLLIIDDLGTELTNNAVASWLFSLLNERHLHRKATVISTNLELSELQERYADRIFSRLLERYTFLKISGPDIRRIKKVNR